MEKRRGGKGGSDGQREVKRGQGKGIYVDGIFGREEGREVRGTCVGGFLWQ